MSGYDEAFFKGDAKLISQLMYDGRKLEVHAIGKDAFCGCKVLTSIVIPQCVTCIDDNAFSGCPKLASVNIPNNVTKIGDNAFFFCPLLTYFYFSGRDGKGFFAYNVLSGLKQRGISAVFHYIPLHSSPAGKRFCRVHGSMAKTEDLSERIIRLPLWNAMTEEHLDRVTEALAALL